MKQMGHADNGIVWQDDCDFLHSMIS